MVSSSQDRGGGYEQEEGSNLGGPPPRWSRGGFQLGEWGLVGTEEMRQLNS